MTTFPEKDALVLLLHTRLAAAEAEVAALRRFAERVITLCEWGPSADIGDDEDVSDAAERAGILVEVPHAQPCEIESCECDGSPTLLQFAWKVDATRDRRDG